MRQLAISPPLAHGHFQRALNAVSLRDCEEALRLFNSAELQGYNPDECSAGRWHCWMLLGSLEQAWKESDSIALRGTDDPDRLWDNLPFNDKRLIIRCLHGLGDALQFIRYARLLHPLTKSLTVETHAALVPLFSTLPYIDKVVTWENGSSKDCTDWDQQIEVMELPRAFRTTLQTIPSEVPYVHVPRRKTLGRKYRIASAARLRVGLVWASSEWNPARSISVTELVPLTHLDLDLFSFQRGPRAAELTILGQSCPVYNIFDYSPGILETAADMANMDLLITVDTMAAHLAGALGIEVWTLLPFEADWRWMLEPSSTPWYPTMKLFRQGAPGDWRSVVAEVTAGLRQLVG